MRSFGRVALLVAAAALAGCGSGGEWKEYRSSTGRFAVRMPSDPDLDDQTLRAGDTPIQQRTYRSVDEQTGVEYSVAYFDLPPERAKLPPEKILAGAQEGALSSIQAKAVRQRALRVGSYPAREFTFEKGAMSGTVRVLLVRNRVFQAIAVGSKTSLNPDAVRRFLDSFRSTG